MNLNVFAIVATWILLLQNAYALKFNIFSKVKLQSICGNKNILMIQKLLKNAFIATGFVGSLILSEVPAQAVTTTIISQSEIGSQSSQYNADIRSFKIPYNRANIPLTDVMGEKATIIFNMKLDDPQTVSQFPMLVEIYEKYKSQGVNAIAFPTEQGWFEPDDDETCRLKAKEYFKFGEFPRSVVFDKVDFLGPSAHPLFKYIAKVLPNPNGVGAITLNYEKILLDSEGTPVRRYPRKFSAYDMIPDIEAILANDPLPPESPKFQKAWREAKREVEKSEYAFRFNYNFYDAPESMYRYNPINDK